MSAAEPSLEPETLQPDEAVADDTVDSALGDDHSSLTQSLRSSLRESIEENGRAYARYRPNASDQWWVPDDEAEQDRLDLQHEMFIYQMDGKLHLSPVGASVGDVLDLGTGTGIWAIEFADAHPESRVIGTDLSPIQPPYVPPNCKFEIDDFNSEWTFSQKFDFIHARGLTAASKDFPKLIRQAWDALKPGGWLEMPETYVPFADIDGTSGGTMIETFNDRQLKGCQMAGIDSTAAKDYKQWMIDQGFENVTELKYKWPIGTWAKGSKAKYLGKLCLINTLAGLEAFTLRLWTGVLGLSTEQVKEDLAVLRRDFSNPQVHAYWPLYHVYGQKPKTA